MTNNKPVLTIMVRNQDKVSLEDLCTVAATAMIWFIDEVENKYRHSKYETELKQWFNTGCHVTVRSANEEQWWQFLTMDGMTEKVCNSYVHVLPPKPPCEMNELVLSCSDKEFNLVDDMDIEPKEDETVFPLLSIILQRKDGLTTQDYLRRACKVALENHYLIFEEPDAEPWSNSNFAINVGIVDLMEYFTPPRIALESKRAQGVDMLGLWIHNPNPEVNV